MTTPRYALLIPVKDASSAKSRLGVAGPDTRARLMAAFAQDSIAAAVACPEVSVYVVGDSSALAELLTGLDATVLPDEGEGDLNRALARAADRVSSTDRGVAALLADLPCLRTEDLSAAFRSAAQRSFVPDAAGTGTTLLISPPGSSLDPHFGIDSARAHQTSGAAQIGLGLTSLRLDVDTTEDLETALRFGVGVKTAAAASQLA